MKVSLILVRKLELSSVPVGAFPTNAPHPLAALSILGKYDAGDECQGSFNIYNALQTAGLPNTAQIPYGGQGFGGINIITKNGDKLPFKVSRALHRVGFGFTCTDQLNSFVYSPLKNTSLKTSVNDVNRDSYISDLEVSSRYIRNGIGFPFAGPNQEISIEDNSFISPNGELSNVPGTSKRSRILPNTGGFSLFGIPESYIGYDFLTTSVEMIPVSNIKAGNIALGRVVGGIWQPVDAANYNVAPYIGTIGQSRAFIASQWEIEIDDVLVTTAQQSNAKIYAVAAATGQFVKYAQPAPYAGSVVLPGPDSGCYLQSLPDIQSLCVNILDLEGSNLRIADWGNALPINRPDGTADPMWAGSSLSSYLMAGVNIGVFDYLPTN